MEITCSGCGKRYKIPRDKLPRTGVAYITCPNCRDKIRLEPPGASQAAAVSHAMEHAPRPRSPLKSSGTEGFEVFEPGTRAALVYCPEGEAHRQIEAALADMGFEVREIRKASEVLARFKYHVYDLVFLYQRGPDAEAELKEILHAINSLDMAIRRQVFVVYVFLAGNRHDSLQAFNLSVDLTINPIDTSKLPDILPAAMEAKLALYSTFEDTRAKLQEEAL